MRPKLKVGPPTSEDLIKKNLAQLYPAALVLVNSACGRVDNQEQPSQELAAKHDSLSSISVSTLQPVCPSLQALGLGKSPSQMIRNSRGGHLMSNSGLHMAST